MRGPAVKCDATPTAEWESRKETASLPTSFTVDLISSTAAVTAAAAAMATATVAAATATATAASASASATVQAAPVVKKYSMKVKRNGKERSGT